MTGNIVWQVLGWVAFALNVWGNLALTTKGVRGWVIRVFSNACWIPYGIATSAWALLANHMLFAVINVYGWRKWSRDAARERDLKDHEHWCGLVKGRNVCNCGRLA